MFNIAITLFVNATESFLSLIIEFAPNVFLISKNVGGSFFELRPSLIFVSGFLDRSMSLLSITVLFVRKGRRKIVLWKKRLCLFCAYTCGF